MKTQGISIIMPGMTGTASAKSTKANDAAFDSFMTNHASKVSSKDLGKNDMSGSAAASDAKDMTVRKAGETSKPQGSAKDKVGGQPNDNQKLDLTNSGKNDAANVETVDVSDVAEQAMAVLKKTFGLSEEELQDIFEQIGIQLQDLLFGIQNGALTAVNQDALQSLVLGVHGVADEAAFLTDSILNGELSQLTEQLQNILAEGFGVAPEELADIEKSLMPDFLERLEQALTAGQEKAVLQEDGSAAEDNLLNQDSMSNVSDTLTVLVEDQTGEAGTEAGSEQSQTGTLTQTKTVSADNRGAGAETAANLFTEKLSQAFEQNGTEAAASASRTMTHIVEQVVTQVRIRVLPETTSMELQLNPASLGRVQLHVSSANGVATARLVVENQMVKEALESQMISLKESFDEQGLKVEAVEVTVSEFSLKKENGQEQGQPGKRSGGRRFRTDSELGTDTEDDSAETGMTETARRDVNSVVDYTA